MEVLENIGFDWQIALANFINFLIIFYILKRFVFGPVKKIVDERQAKIQAGIDKAQQSETELLVAQQKAQQEIKAARSQANQIVADAQDQADAQISAAKGIAEKEAQAVLDNAGVQIEKNRQSMEKELFEKTAGLVTLGVQKILEEEVDAKKNTSLNKRALEILKQQ